MSRSFSMLESWCYHCSKEITRKCFSPLRNPTGLEKISSFQSQRKAMPKNAQTTAQLHSSHTLVKKCLKFFKPGFSNMWTLNFQMFKLVLEKAEEPDVKMPTSAGSWKKQESSRKTSISALLTMPKAFDCVDHNKLWKILKEMGIPDHLICLLRNLYAGQEATVRTGHGTTDWFQNRERNTSRLYIVPLLN